MDRQRDGSITDCGRCRRPALKRQEALDEGSVKVELSGLIG